MAVAIPTPADMPGAGVPAIDAQAADGVDAALARLRPVADRRLAAALRAAPWVLTLCAIYLLGVFGPHSARGGVAPLNLPPEAVAEGGGMMLATGVAAAAAGLFAGQLLLACIPETFRTLWRRKVIAIPRQRDLGQSSRVTVGIASDAPLRSAAQLEARYAAYVDGVGRWLNHPWQWAVGALFGLLVLTWAAIEPVITPVIALILGLEAVVGFLSGLVVWRMVVTGVQVWRLGKEFAVVPQLGHPDGCGGLEPLGMLCFKNALLPSITGVFLGSWLIIGPSTPYRYWAEYYGPLYSGLLLVPTVVALVSFLLPLWSVHRLMVTWADDVSKQLDELGRRIAELAEQMLDGAKDLEPAAGAEHAKKLEVWRKFHKQHRHVPVWPFNSAIMVKFATAQVVPLLGLTGLGEPVVKVVTSVATSFGGAPK